MSFLRVVLSIAAAGSLIFGFQNCSKVAFTGDPTADLASVVTPTGVPQGPVTTTEATLKTLQPALAVRAMACVLCHANIKANVITDFGAGTANFLGGGAHFYNDQNWYTDHAGTWQSSHIMGSVYVPNIQVTRSAQNVLGPAYQNMPLLNLKDFMQTPYETTSRDYLTDAESHGEMAFNVSPAAGTERVVAKSHIKIRAPSIGEIQALAPELWAPQASMSGAARVGSSAAMPLPLQLTESGSPGKTYLQNNENTVLECANSDIVVRGSLLLRRLKVNAAGGCRLYVTGTVFIEEGITYTGGALQNLQITSASAVMMGLDIKNIENRLITDRRGLEIVSRDMNSLAQQVVSEAQNIGNLKDAINDYPSRASYDYTGLLLNAPIVHSRYLGLVRGTIISEAILFALGHFEFQFDPVFTQVNVLPMLKESVLEVK